MPGPWRLPRWARDVRGAAARLSSTRRPTSPNPQPHPPAWLRSVKELIPTAPPTALCLLLRQEIDPSPPPPPAPSPHERSVKELIPTALRYDPKDSLATTCVIAGMVVMAASLLLFTL